MEVETFKQAQTLSKRMMELNYVRNMEEAESMLRYVSPECVASVLVILRTDIDRQIAEEEQKFKAL